MICSDMSDISIIASGNLYKQSTVVIIAYSISTPAVQSSHFVIFCPVLEGWRWDRTAITFLLYLVFHSLYLRLPNFPSAVAALCSSKEIFSSNQEQKVTNLFRKCPGSPTHVFLSTIFSASLPIKKSLYCMWSIKSCLNSGIAWVIPSGLNRECSLFSYCGAPGTQTHCCGVWVFHSNKEDRSKPILLSHFGAAYCSPCTAAYKPSSANYTPAIAIRFLFTLPASTPHRIKGIKEE